MGNHFFELISSEKENNENVLVALFPPKIKPQNNFELSDDEMKMLQELLNNKNVVLYLFGNPYVLNIINFEKAKAVVVVYQDFKVFQENAAHHFLGKIKAKGKLPVTIHIK